jgi:hypothetical protein
MKAGYSSKCHNTRRHDPVRLIFFADIYFANSLLSGI